MDANTLDQIRNRDYRFKAKNDDTNFYPDNMPILPLKPTEEEQKAIAFNRKVRSKQGSTILYADDTLTCKLRSLDGQNWYAFDLKNHQHFLGNAEEIYPRLVAQIQGWKALTEYTIKNGAVRQMPTANEVRLLEQAGFTVEFSPENKAKNN